MTERMNLIFSTWNSYWGNGIYQYLLLAALLYLLICRRHRKSTRQTIPYMLLFLLLFFFPVTAAVIQKCIGADTYWRVLWLLPTGPVIALAAVEFLSVPVSILQSKCSARQKSPLPVVLLLVLTIPTAFLCGRGMLQSGNYVRVHNYQKVPQEVAHICNLVSEHAQGEPIKLASDEHIISYVRVYDASIQMPYGRRGDGASGEAAKELYEHMYTNTYKYARIAKLAKKTGCNFIAIVLTKDSAVETMAKHGYQQIGTVNSYGIFQLTE